MRSSRASAAALAGLILLLAPGAGALAGRQGGATSIHRYRAFSDGAVAPGVRVGRTARGYCWTTSISDARPDAYRCFIGNEIYDPCFADAARRSSFVLCPSSPPTGKVVRIDLTRKLPSGSAGSDPTRYPPWQVETANGRWCELLDGATSRVAGLPVMYGCFGGGVLLGDPHRSSEPWTISYASGYRAKRARAVAIESAWW